MDISPELINKSLDFIVSIVSKASEIYHRDLVSKQLIVQLGYLVNFNGDLGDVSDYIDLVTVEEVRGKLLEENDALEFSHSDLIEIQRLVYFFCIQYLNFGTFFETEINQESLIVEDLRRLKNQLLMKRFSPEAFDFIRDLLNKFIGNVTIITKLFVDSYLLQEVGSREILVSCDILLRDQISKHAKMNAVKQVQNLINDAPMNIILSVDRIEEYLRTNLEIEVKRSASVYLASVTEYIFVELIELVGLEVVGDDVTKENIIDVLSRDRELSESLEI